VLQHVGWTLQGFDFDEYEASGSTLTVDAVVIQLLESVMTGGQLAIVESAISALKGLSSDDARFTIFDRSSHEVHSSNFRLAAVSEDDGAVAMAMGAFYFDTSQRIENVLIFHFGGTKTALHHAAQVATLDSEIYAQVRDPIVTKLGDDAQKYIEKLPDLH
jgi:hypothetical protein